MLDFTKFPEGEICCFNKGDVIIKQEEKLEYIYYLTEGVIYRTVLNEKGDETIYDTKSGNNSLKSALGILYLFNDGCSYTNFIAKSTCTCYRIPKKVVMDAIKNDPIILYELVEIAMNFYNTTISLIEQRQQRTAVNRLCQFLLDQSEYKNNKLAVRKACTNAEISRFLGVHQVTVGRIVKCLKDEGVIIRCKNGLTILDPEKLRQYANDECCIVYS